MESMTSETSISDITAPPRAHAYVNPRKSRGREKRLSSPQRQGTLFGCGVSFVMILDSKELTARYSVMSKVDIDRLTLSERLMPLLISRGLVRGITPTFARRRSLRAILAGVSYARVGVDADTQKAGC